MAKITMKTAYLPTVEQIFSLWLSASAAKGVTDKTLETYRSHFQAIGKRLDVSVPIAELTGRIR